MVSSSTDDKTTVYNISSLQGVEWYEDFIIPVGRLNTAKLNGIWSLMIIFIP